MSDKKKEYINNWRAWFNRKKSLIKVLIKDFNLKILDTSPQIKRHKDYINKFHKNEIKFISCNILNKNKLNKRFNNIDIVIHLAAMLG